MIDDRDGTHYRTVTIAGQTWLAESLNYGAKRDWAAQPADGDPSMKYCLFDSELWCARIGALYAFSDVMALPTRCTSTDCSSLISHPQRGICPVGWHIPSGQEYRTLLAGVGVTEPSGCNTAVALRAARGWIYADVVTNATDSSGFSAFPQALLKSAGTYWANRARFWTADAPPDSFRLLDLTIGHDCASLDSYLSVTGNRDGLRCVKD
jgi:uncharacterized protein (TIGR02145 family)